MRTAPGNRARTWLVGALRTLGAVLPQWVVGRVIVVASLALAHLVVDRLHPALHGATARVHSGLLGWDAGWYETIARYGYGPLGHQSLRFFPLFPLAGRALSDITGLGEGAALVGIANVSALAGTALLFVLVRRESGDPLLARRATWLVSIVPPAFTFVMGYAEGPLLLLSVGCFLGLRRAAWRTKPGAAGQAPAGIAGAPGADARGWLWAALWGFGAGLTRPLGVLLAVPAAVEAARRWGRSTLGERAAALLSVLGPLCGAGAFLAWSAAAFGDGLLPLRVQTQSRFHGGLSNPFHTLFDDARGALHHHFGTAIHVPWVVLVVILVVVTFRRWPASYGAFSAAVVLAALSGTNLDSFERYALSAFPLVMTGGALTASRTVERVVLCLAAAGLAAYALLTFFNLLVP